MIIIRILLFVLWMPSVFALPYGVEIDVENKAALQRGAKWFMNYCSGCHSLQYQRYQRLAEDVGIKDIYGKDYVALLKKTLIVTQVAKEQPMLSAMDSDHAAKWFGVAPPDLSLTAKYRGSEWIYNYLMGFYADGSRPFGVNNQLIPNVAMPNVLETLQGIRRLRDKAEQRQKPWAPPIAVVSQGQLSQAEFRELVVDLVTFLTYVSDPNEFTRKSWRIWVMLYLVGLVGLAYFLKRAYWQDV